MKPYVAKHDKHAVGEFDEHVAQPVKQVIHDPLLREDPLGQVKQFELPAAEQVKQLEWQICANNMHCPMSNVFPVSFVVILNCICVFIALWANVSESL